MVELDKQLHDFQTDEFGTYLQLRSLAESKEDSVLFVGCSDQGTAPDNISFLEPERVVIIQNLAASIPRPDENTGSSTLGTIEYGVFLLRASHIIVCAHLGCKILRNWHKHCTSGSPEKKVPLQAKQVVAALNQHYPEASPSERLALFIREYLLLQLENLRSIELVKQKLEARELLLHGWLVNDETARILSYSPDSGQFEPIERTT